MGTSDLAKDLHCAHTQMRLPMLHSLSICVLAARAAGLAILDGVHLDLDDDEGYRKACRAGLEMGFDGKTLIHPKTIEVANEVFAPSEEDIAWAQKIIAAYRDAVSQGSAVVLVDGKLIENLHVEGAERIVRLVEAIEARDP
jgi:citrate lyase subunit beta/citryl-CoA lyase